MTMRCQVALRLSFFISISITALPMRAGSSAESGEISTPAHIRQASAGQRGAGKKDHVALHQERGRLLVEVQHVTGIGGTQLHSPVRGWPKVVVVRLHDFAELESFRASTADADLGCEKTRPEGVPPRLACHLGEAEIQAIRQQPGYFEIALPSMLLAADGPIEIRWVDQWR